MKIKFNVSYPNRIEAVGETANGNVFRGVAKKHPDDTFNIKKGKRIAELKAKEKQLKAIEKSIDESLSFLNEDFDNLLWKIGKKNRKLFTVKEQRAQILKEIEEIIKE